MIRDRTIDGLATIEVEGERHVHVCEGQMVLRSDLVAVPGTSFVPEPNVLDRDAMGRRRRSRGLRAVFVTAARWLAMPEV